MKLPRAVVFLALLLALPIISRAQTTTPPSPPTSLPGWNVLINGAFSTANGDTNNGTALTEELALTSHYAIRADQYLLNNPSVTVALGGVEYRIPATSIFKVKTTTVNLANVTFFVNGEIGTAHATVQASEPITQRHLAVGFGGGFDYCLSATVCLRPLDLKYVNGGVMTNGGKVLGNGLQFGAGLNLRF